MLILSTFIHSCNPVVIDNHVPFLEQMRQVCPLRLLHKPEVSGFQSLTCPLSVYPSILPLVHGSVSPCLCPCPVPIVSCPVFLSIPSPVTQSSPCLLSNLSCLNVIFLSQFTCHCSPSLVVLKLLPYEAINPIEYKQKPLRTTRAPNSSAPLSPPPLA
jgi:hypothetical protein